MTGEDKTMINSEKYISKRASGIKASAIREMFKLMANADIISLAGGSPAPELFPGEELAEIARDILKNNPSLALSYGVTDGYPRLMEKLRKRAEKINSVKDTDRIIVTTGAQQGLDLAIKVLVNDGEAVVVEAPSFVGTLNSFRSHRAEMIGVPLENDGMNMEKLEEVLKANKVKLIYTIPTFQNPSGITMSLAKRKKMLELASKYDVLILEDNPYGDLRFSGEDIPTVKSLDTEGRVIYVGSLSKILSPGMRIGYTIAEPGISDRIEVMKQANDVHTPVLTQMIADEYMNRYDLDAHIEKSKELYGRKCAFMLSCMDKYFPASVTYTRPEGGIFIMCTAPEGTDTNALLRESLKYNVAFVAGNSFEVDQSKPSNMFRLNYSTMSEEKIEQGIKALAKCLREVLGEK